MQIKDLLNIPYKNRGQTFSGCDCYGLSLVYYKKILNKTLLSYSEQYSDSNCNIEIGAIIEENKLVEWYEVEEPQKHDLIVFRVNRYPMHIGVYIGDGQFLHTMKSIGSSCIEKIHSKVWNKRILKYFRHRDFIND